MRQTTASNLALALVVLAWPLAYFGVMSQLGDYAPSTPRAVIEANSHRSTIILLAGLLCLFSSLWLSGYSFAGAKIRSVVAAIACVAPMAIVILALWQ
ncbi:hypothetical protein [Pseudoxanthomonas sacheonensis]|uniref:Uncharacterized protein n=1 Tax=Pseudoxanthomonas sacheonensis TaxID=443615 RepID=A0ABU1RUA6_9GAMM|nr:hypothetical protein [Pseudoxanthomonas sacheonensis]MDR6841505.1 hypothetical protein [Pseudoxanthomonas sacheonensis]